MKAEVVQLTIVRQNLGLDVPTKAALVRQIQENRPSKGTAWAAKKLNAAIRQIKLENKLPTLELSRLGISQSLPNCDLALFVKPEGEDIISWYAPIPHN